MTQDNERMSETLQYLEGKIEKQEQNSKEMEEKIETLEKDNK
jgi:hypothetical protein